MLSKWNWYGFSASYAAVNLIDLAIQFSLTGIGIAWLYKREMQGCAGGQRSGERPVVTLRG